MDADALLYARLQFAFTVSFHIIFPAFTIGLSAFIATLLVMWQRTGVERYRTLAKFWTKIFAVSFAMGVVSGIVLSYQFGTNWSRFSEVVGNVIGPLIGYEVLTAFFLEASFLGVMLFGWNRVPPWLHVTSAILVAIGTLISAFWILSANSWMQYPTGFEMRDGIAHPTDWLTVVFNPTFPYRFAHMVVACYLTTSFVVIAVGARYLLAGREEMHARTMMKMGLGMAIVLAPLQAMIGDAHGIKTLEVQPAKIAALEAHWDKKEEVDAAGHGVPLILFAVPNPSEERNDFEIAIPRLGSLILTHSWQGSFPGLKDFAPQDRPPVWGPFIGFRIMVGLGLLMIAVAAWGVVEWARGALDRSRLFLRVASLMWPVGFLAILAGWIVTEQGRQPWIATGILRTADAASPVPGTSVLSTLILFVLVYTVVFGIGVLYINRLINRGPAPLEKEPEGVPNRPLSAAENAGREVFGGTE